MHINIIFSNISNSIVSETVMYTKVFKDNTIHVPCCSGNIGDVFLGYLSIFIEKHVAHQNLPNAYNNERTATSRTTERLPRVCN